MVAFVDDHEPVPGGDLPEIVSTGETLGHCQIDDAAGLPAGSDLTNTLLVETEVGHQALAPLLDERLTVDDHEGRNAVMGD